MLHEEGTALAEMRVNKPEAARRQIDAAIRLLFSNDDPVAVQTLAAAGFRILRDLAHGGEKGEMQRIFRNMIKPGMEGEFWTALNRAANFLKHADEDPDGILEDVQEELNDSMLMFACMYYQDLGYQLTATMIALVSWYAVMHPEFILDNAPVKKVIPKELTESLRSASRPEQLKMGRLALEQAKGQAG